MPRTIVLGDQADLENSIEAASLATNSVITEKIKDGNVTGPKLAPEIYERLLATNVPIWRFRLKANHMANTDFDISPANYNLESFMTRTAIYRNGQLLFNGLVPPTEERDSTDVYPGTSNSMLKFVETLIRGDTIQVVLL